VTVILQWNCNSYFKRLPEIQQLISKYHQTIVALQETHLQPKHTVQLSKFNVYRHDNINPQHTNGGTGKIPSKRAKTPSIIQNVAVTATIPPLSNLLITFCSIYIPPSQHISKQEITDLLLSLPRLFVLLGDFNARNPMWGGTRYNSKGNVIENILSSSYLWILITQ
jgi:exonuclease III